MSKRKDKLNSEIDFKEGMIKFVSIKECEQCGKKIFYVPINRLYIRNKKGEVVINSKNYNKQGLFMCSKCVYVGEVENYDREEIGKTLMTLIENRMLKKEIYDEEKEYENVQML